MSATAVEFTDVGFIVASGQRILSDISLRLEEGTTTALLGRSGSGKTTLLRTVNALVLPTSGTVSITELGNSSANLLPLRRSIGYVIQETGLFPHMTIARNVSMALELAGVQKDERAKRANDMLQLVGLGEGFAQRLPRELSGGQRQRAGLARALVSEPKVLLMDEPFGALDPITRGEMQRMLRELLQRLRKTTLIVTHDLQEALFLADRVILMSAGSIVADMPASEVRNSSNEAMRAYVLAATPAEAKIA